MCGDVFINEAANHLLIFQAMFVSLSFEKIHTTFRQSQGNFYYGKLSRIDKILVTLLTQK